MANYFSLEQVTTTEEVILGQKGLPARRQIVKKFTVLYKLSAQHKTFVLMLLSESPNESDEMEGGIEVNMRGNLQSI